MSFARGDEPMERRGLTPWSLTMPCSPVQCSISGGGAKDSVDTRDNSLSSILHFLNTEVFIHPHLLNEYFDPSDPTDGVQAGVWGGVGETGGVQ